MWTMKLHADKLFDIPDRHRVLRGASATASTAGASSLQRLRP
jgi:hypothetical protein